ncbi:MAG: aminotransferase class V-fold PLP-dependent enzyme, partial [Alphaproteobacteria bacterium]|nr:aminotransferase class V-fold PLP-dependent enzyme [Alphaproteobacteria bacterium]
MAVRASEDGRAHHRLQARHRRHRGRALSGIGAEAPLLPRTADREDRAVTPAELDAVDPLRGFRDRFRLPAATVYLDGNSLGALPETSVARMADVVAREWGRDLIRSWNANAWIEAPARIGAAIAPLIGAGADEVIACDSTSVNLHKLLTAALAARPGRRVVLSEPGNFPTDLYMAEGVRGAELRLATREALIDAIDESVAVVMLTHVHYKSGAVHDMAAITAATQAAGALVLWDLSHSAGAIPVDLNGCNADLAVGCGYKYLNGGPGAPAFLFVARRHQGALTNPLSGWMGHAAPFAFEDGYRPADGMARWLCGTPPVLSLLALETGVAITAEAGMAAIEAKRRTMSELLIAEVTARCPELELA